MRMSVGEQWKKNIEKNNKQIANEKQTTISHGTTNMETSEIQQTHLTYNGEIYFFFYLEQLSRSTCVQYFTS